MKYSCKKNFVVVAQTGLFDQLRVELLQIHQQQKPARDRRVSCFRGSTTGTFTFTHVNEKN